MERQRDVMRSLAEEGRIVGNIEGHAGRLRRGLTSDLAVNDFSNGESCWICKEICMI
jgi:hypothetical protein